MATGFVDRTSINNDGDVAFLAGRDLGSYLFSRAAVSAVCLSSGGTTVSIVKLQDRTPEGEKFAILGKGLGFNNRGDLTFGAETDTRDRAVYLYTRATGNLRRIAGKGTLVPGEGTITDVQLGFFSYNTDLNDLGQIVFVASITDGTTTRQAMVLATPGNSNN